MPASRAGRACQFLRIRQMRTSVVPICCSYRSDPSARLSPAVVVSYRIICTLPRRLSSGRNGAAYS